jgi:hypothetical protein
MPVTISSSTPRRSTPRRGGSTPAALWRATLDPVPESADACGDSAVANLFGGAIVEESTATAVAVAVEGVSDTTNAAPPANDDASSAYESCSDGPGLGTPQPPVPRQEAMASPVIRTLPHIRILEGLQELGYDTDGLPAPEQEEELDPVEEEPTLADLEDISPSAEDETPRFIPIPAANLSKMTVAALKRELNIRCVPFKPTLKKGELQERLQQALDQGLLVSVFGDLSKKKKPGKRTEPNDMAGFAPGAFWAPLVPNPIPVTEPVNTFANARAPTVPVEEALAVSEKHNFDATFDRPLFNGRRKVPVMDANGVPKLDREGNQVLETKIRLDIGPRRDFQLKHKLTKYSDPVEFAEAFFPMHENPYGPSKLSQSLLTSYTNLKAGIANAGDLGGVYSTFQPFTVKEIRQHLGVYLWHGLAPSPRLEMKFRTATEDPLHGNDFIFKHMGANATMRNKHFRAFLAFQDPRATIPVDRKKDPLFKVSSIVKWINFIGPTSVDLGERLSIDEQTMGFQGRHADKLRISYKTEGDGFQCEAMSQDGFTYVVYFRNVTAPRNYLIKGLSPLHSRCLWMMDFLRDKGHRIHMDNLYLSAKFAKACFNHPMQVLIAGVTRKSGRGLPACVLQEEQKNKRLQLAARGTVKAAVLKGDKDCVDLVACSFYDTKPVHIISMVCEDIKWIEKYRMVYDPDQAKMVGMNFLRLNLNDDYNNDMGHVDVADQLRGNYRMDRWIRQYKWWWSIWIWGFGVLLVNAYIFYQRVMEESGVDKKDRLSHYEFRRRIALAWVQKDEPSIKQRRKANLPTPASIAGKRKATPPTSARATRRKTIDHSTPESIIAVDAQAKEASIKKGKSSAVTDQSLTSTTGPFAKRLDSDANVRHWMAVVPNRPKCALHRWACGNEMSHRLNVFSCTFCMVNLCVDCFCIFHSEPGDQMVANKKQFAEHFDKKRAANKTPA